MTPNGTLVSTLTTPTHTVTVERDGSWDPFVVELRGREGIESRRRFATETEAVAHAEGLVADDGYQATCRCGWVSVAYATHALASAALHQHAESVGHCPSCEGSGWHEYDIGAGGLGTAPCSVCSGTGYTL